MEAASGGENDDKTYSISCTANAVPKASFAWSVTDKEKVTSDLIGM